MFAFQFSFFKIISVLLTALLIQQSTSEENFRHGLDYYNSNNMISAEESFTLAIQEDPKMQMAYYYRALTRFNNADFSGAVSDLNTSIRLNRQHSPSYLYRALLRLNLGLSQKMILSDFDKAIEYDSNYCDAYKERGLYYFDLEDYHNAKSDYTKAVELMPENIEILMKLADCKYFTLDTAGARDIYLKVIQLDPNNYLAHYELSYIYVWQDNDEKAIEAITKSLELNPKFAEGYVRLARIYSWKRKTLNKAEELLKNAIVHNPEWSNAYNNLANFYHFKEDYEKAILNYDKAIEIAPLDTFYYVNRAKTYFEMKRVYKAMQDIRHAINLNPNFYRSYYILSDYYYGKQQYDSALYYANKSIGCRRHFESYVVRAFSKLHLLDSLGFCNDISIMNTYFHKFEHKLRFDFCKDLVKRKQESDKPIKETDEETKNEP